MPIGPEKKKSELKPDILPLKIDQGQEETLSQFLSGVFQSFSFPWLFAVQKQ